MKYLKNLNQQLFDSLIAIRDHYQSLQEELERSLAHALEQMTHINALLVDQIVEQQRFVESLVEMRTHYQGIVEQCLHRIYHAREQLTHVDALLADQEIQQHNQPVSMSASTVDEQKSYNEPTTHSSSLKYDLHSVPTEARHDCARESEVFPSSLAQTADITVQKSSNQQDEADWLSFPDQAEEPDETWGASDVAVVDEWEEMDETVSPEATENIVSPDVDTLEGVSSNSEFTLTPAMLATQSEPRDEFWNKVDSPLGLNGRDSTDKGVVQGCPLYSEKLLPSPSPSVNVSVNSQAIACPTAHVTPLMLPSERQMTLFEAVENLLSESAGSILHVDYIIRTLYGQLEPNAIKSETATILDVLDRGASESRWDQVPDEDSCYTLELKLVAPELAAQALQVRQVGKPPFTLPRRKLAIKPLPQYQNLSLTDAIGAILKSSAPTPLNIDAVTQKLFGAVDSITRKSVADLLVKGVLKRHWRRVAGLQGTYVK